jgi:hypothetical protein
MKAYGSGCIDPHWAVATISSEKAGLSPTTFTHLSSTISRTPARALQSSVTVSNTPSIISVHSQVRNAVARAARSLPSHEHSSTSSPENVGAEWLFRTLSWMNDNKWLLRTRSLVGKRILWPWQQRNAIKEAAQVQYQTRYENGQCAA